MSIPVTSKSSLILSVPEKTICRILLEGDYTGENKTFYGPFIVSCYLRLSPVEISMRGGNVPRS